MDLILVENTSAHRDFSMVVGFQMPNKNYSVVLVEEVSVTINTLLWDPVLAVSQDEACQDRAVEKGKQNRVKTTSLNISVFCAKQG